MRGSKLLRTTYGKAGYDFANALASKDYVKAHQMLSLIMKKTWKPETLKERYEEMIEYGEGDADEVEAMEGYDDYPSKEEGDLGGVYVAISGEHFSEAVMVFVKTEDGEPKIRKIEWGRP